MNPREANILLTRAALLDGRLRREPEDLAEMATAWSQLLDAVPLDAGLEAVAAHYREQTRSVMPADIIALTEDMPAGSAEGSQDATEWLRAHGVNPDEFRARVEAGERPTRVLRELGAGVNP